MYFNFLAGVKGVVTPAICAETAALVAAMSVAPPASDLAAIDALIVGMKANGIWALLDVFYSFESHDQQAARLNWKNPGSNTLTEHGGITWLEGLGYTGNLTDAYLDPGYNPSVASLGYAQNNACAGVWARSNGTTNNNDIQSDNAALRLRARLTTTSAFNINGGGALIAVTGASAMPVHSHGQRTASNSRSLYINGVLDVTGTAVSTGLPTAITFLGNTVQAVYCNRNDAVVYVGQQMTANLIKAFYNLLLVFTIAMEAPRYVASSFATPPKIAALGHSQLHYGYAVSATANFLEYIGPQHWLTLLSNGRVDFDPALDFTEIATSTQDQIDHGHVADAAAASCDAVLYLGYVGDSAFSLPYSQSAANLATIRDTILNAGKKLIMVCSTPRGDPHIFTASQLANDLALGSLIKGWANSGSYPGLYVADPYASMLKSGSTNGEAADGMLSDGLHETPTGGLVLAQAIEPTIESIYPAIDFTNYTSKDRYSVAFSVPHGCLNTNPLMTGAVAGLATDWSLLDGSGGGVVTTFSKETVNGIEWQAVNISGTPLAAVPYIAIYQTITTSSVSAADKLRATMAESIDAGCYGVSGLGVESRVIVDGASYFAMTGDANNSAETIPATAHSGVMRSPLLTVPAGSLTAVTLYCKIQLSQSVPCYFHGRFRCTSLRKE